VKINNSLSQKYLIDYPVEAARILEQVSAADAAALFVELPLQTSALVFAAMLPEKSASCLELIAVIPAAKLLTELPVTSAARVYRLLSTQKQETLTAAMSDKTQKRLRRFLKYPASSAGALLDLKFDMLPENITVADAIRRIEHLGRAVNCELYIVNNTHQLVGMIELGRLLAANHHSQLRDVMMRKSQPVSVHAMADSLPAHPGWATRRRLPVVERDNTLIGVLEYRRLQEVMGAADSTSLRDPVENFLSLTRLYWISLAQLLNSLFSISRKDLSSFDRSDDGERK